MQQNCIFFLYPLTSGAEYDSFLGPDLNFLKKLRSWSLVLDPVDSVVGVVASSWENMTQCCCCSLHGLCSHRHDGGNFADGNSYSWKDGMVDWSKCHCLSGTCEGYRNCWAFWLDGT